MVVGSTIYFFDFLVGKDSNLPATKVLTKDEEPL